MLLYQSKTNNPYFNIATEEYFLKNFKNDFFCLYINEPSIIVGKHQNTTAEINVPWVFKNNIKVVRRLSGGGTVFHDKGNLNFCFIKKGVKGYLVDFKKYTQPILSTLQNLGVKAFLHGKSDLVINNKKFSGNAEHVYHSKVLHHGTLLFASQLSTLNEAVNTNWSQFNDKAVRSNRSKVTNILPYLDKPITIDEFKNEIIKTVLSINGFAGIYELTDDDEIAINKLVANKYSTWEWNFGYSPDYKFSKSITIKDGVLSLKMVIKKGVIKNAKFALNNVIFANAELFENAILNTPHYYILVKQRLDALYNQNSNLPFTFTEVLKLAF